MESVQCKSDLLHWWQISARTVTTAFQTRGNGRSVGTYLAQPDYIEFVIPVQHIRLAKVITLFEGQVQLNIRCTGGSSI